MSMSKGRWAAREQAKQDEAWALFVKIVARRRATVEEGLDAVQRKYGLSALAEVERRMRELAEQEQ